MKPKKNPGADLRRRRTLFFEIGMVVALTTAIVVFSVNNKERPEFKLPPVTMGEPIELPPVIKEEKKPETRTARVKLPSDWFIVKSNDTYIPVENTFDGFDEEPYIKPVKIEEEKIDEPVIRSEVMPKFMGGDLEVFRKWVADRFRYPSLAIENRITGKVLLEFVVEKDGSLSQVKVVQTPDSILSDEVVRVVSQSPRWTPGMNGITPVRIRYYMPIEFKLEN